MWKIFIYNLLVAVGTFGTCYLLSQMQCYKLAGGCLVAGVLMSAPMHMRNRN